MVVDALSLKTSKVRLDNAVGNLVCGVPVDCIGVGLDGLQRSLPTLSFCDLMKKRPDTF